jgi:hypothetical protein
LIARDAHVTLTLAPSLLEFGKTLERILNATHGCLQLSPRLTVINEKPPPALGDGSSAELIDL